MPLAETLISNVAPAIAKGILKRWIKDDVGFFTGGGIVDAVKAIITDAFAQQKGKNQFESIGTQVAESLLPIFEVEGGPLDEGARNSVAATLAEALNKAVITPKLLAEKDLDPTNLARHLKAAIPDATKNYSQDETALYDRLISECSQCIIDIASQLPQFTERTIAEVLRREGQLLDIAKKTLAEVERIRKASEQDNPEEKARRFEEDYRREVVRTLDKLELFGADLSEASKRHRLSVAYVTLSVQHKPTEKTVPQTGRAETVEAGIDEEKDDEDWSIVPVDEALQSSRCLLVRGLAGSGKTTLLQWLAVRSASRDFDADFAAWNETIPFFIRLRQFAGKALPTPEEFVRLIAPAIAGIMPTQWVHEHLLRQGKALVLIDGIDEVPETQRSRVREWIQGLVAVFPARFLVTARPHAVEEGWLQQEQFKDVELQPMDLASIDNFVDHWHQAASEALQNDKEKAELPALAEHLKQEVKDKKPIRNLATSPLLCAMLCALHRDRHKQIPNDRIALYEACCDLLINRRDIEREIDLSDYLPLTARQKRALLEDIAYWMLRNGQAIAPLSEARQHLQSRVDNLQGLPVKPSSASVMRLLTDRTGVMREPVKGQVDFTHLTFRDFLAAQAILDEGDIGVLLEHATDDRWREVILLSVGLATGTVKNDNAAKDTTSNDSEPKISGAERIIKGLIKLGDENEQVQHQLHLLAVTCLEMAAECSKQTKSELQIRLKKLVPPQSMTEATALASAGELALPYLGFSHSYKVGIAEKCVRTLSLIGGELALSMLEGWAQDYRRGVRKQLCRAMSYFNTEEYARRVLRRFPNLELEQISNIEELQGLTSLVHLHLKGGTFTDLKGLESLSNLHSLTLSQCNYLINIYSLINLQYLTMLDIYSCYNIKDFRVLRGVKTLRQLTLWGYLQPTDWEFLYSMSDLDYLRIGYSRTLVNVEPLKHLNKLGVLSLHNCSEVNDLSPLAGLTNLRYLDLEGCTQVHDLSPLTGLKHLDNVDLTGLSESVQQQWRQMSEERRNDLTSVVHADDEDLDFLSTLRIPDSFDDLEMDDDE